MYIDLEASSERAFGFYCFFKNTHGSFTFGYALCFDHTLYVCCATISYHLNAYEMIFHLCLIVLCYNVHSNYSRTPPSCM